MWHYEIPSRDKLTWMHTYIDINNHIQWFFIRNRTTKFNFLNKIQENNRKQNPVHGFSTIVHNMNNLNKLNTWYTATRAGNKDKAKAAPSVMKFVNSFN